MRCNAKYRRNVYAWLNIENQENVFVTDINKKESCKEEINHHNSSKRKQILLVNVHSNASVSSRLSIIKQIINNQPHTKVRVA